MPSNPQGVLWGLARVLRAIYPDSYLPGTWVFLFVAHCLEGLYAISLARKYRMPWNIGVRPLTSFVLAIVSVT